MTTGDRAGRESQLRAYYAKEISSRATRELDPRRTDLRSDFIDLLRREQRVSILELGCGAGRDGTALSEAGLDYLGVDLTPESVQHCRRLGLAAEVASVLDLPFADDTFEAGWTMSTLMHLAHDDLGPALAECARVLRPGAPLGIGMWGNATKTTEVSSSEFGERPFYRTDDDRLRSTLATIGTVERFDTWHWTDTPSHYQVALVRIGEPPR
jgi:SAM-dependent methyltransferase